MMLRVKALVCVVVAGAVASLYLTSGYQAQQWVHFFVYLAAILVSSGMKVGMPKSEGTMCVNFPFILLGILECSPLQAVILATSSVIAQCRIRVIKPFTLVQILFNVANVATATVLAWHTYAGLLGPLHQEVAPTLAVAATVYFLANTIPVALVIAWESQKAPIRQWRQEFLWYLPFYLVGAMLAAAANLIGIRWGWMTSLLLVPLLYIIYRGYRANVAIIRDRERHIAETEALHLRTIEGLAMAIEAKDKNTHRHLMRVRVYVSELGKLMGLDPSIMQALQTAAYLHDIGKLAVPEYIINKPGKLTREEFEIMKIHPVVGADILERVKFPYPVVPIVRSHHEAWDGSGYPDGLKGQEIPIGARILTAVDCFDALASERPYRRALPLDEAMALVKSKAGIQFDPDIVRLLAEHHPRLEELARQRIEEIQPLKTDLFIERGAAPAAGFEQHAQASDEGDRAAGVHHDPLDLIAAASLEAKAVFELTQMLGTSLSARETSSIICRRLLSLIPFDCFAVYLKSEESLLTLYMDGVCARAFSERPIPLGEGLSGWVAHNGRPIVNGNPTVEPNFLPNSAAFTAASSALSIPLFDLNGSVLGVLTIYAARHAAFSKDHLRILQAIQTRLSLSLQNALRFYALETDASLDDLTQLPNMRHFLRQVDAETRNASDKEGCFAVAVCDLNAFKAVNDRHGHRMGDDLLRAIGQAFRGCCGAKDTIARMGGDEFAFLFPGMDAPSARHRLELMEEAVRRACIELELELDLSSSMGIAFYPENGKTAEELLGMAERNMYLQKRSFCRIYRNGQTVFRGLPA